MADTAGRVGRSPMMFCCCTPKEHCNGGKNGKENSSFHSTADQVRACQTRYYVNVLGYKQLSPREFEAPNGGPVLVFSKHPTRAKPGKSPGLYMARPSKVRCI